eukprot:CAMPEP_0205920378 /NCGR_PEP_ID=MMETSP1325-20131115/11103_1 /ASSEMBLY_ACC=CAM_ASM_000708 /TAXON_ID=236786 /ORGANISM="Florenciella sp., Strain RCC1007" /LENGTH=131 /DNA_ID=CAMNT_0053288061 /DNA_START=44 /DNA_END=439 /DNA_ORIENTATION=-
MAAAAEGDSEKYQFSETAKVTELKNSWTQHLDRLPEEKGYVVGVTNSSVRVCTITLDFSNSENMEIKNFYGCEELSELSCSKELAPDEQMVVKICAADPSVTYKYKMGMSGAAKPDGPAKRAGGNIRQGQH